MQIEKAAEFCLDGEIGQLRAVTVHINGKSYILTIHSSEFDVDPYYDMFYFPKDTLKMTLFDLYGRMVWQKDLGRSVVPGMWFCPVLAFDLDGDGRDEIWFVNNISPSHPLSLSHYRLERLDPETGETSGRWDWPHEGGYDQAVTFAFRNFLACGYVHGEPVLVTAQGTYNDMYLQGWNRDMKTRFAIKIDAEDGPRGSHRSPVLDINQDGADEIMWGEHCISLDTGAEIFCADREVYHGHSDMIAPIWNEKEQRWYLYTARESDPQAVPRVILFDDRGRRVWGELDHGHMDMSWAARVGDEREPIVMSIRIGAKTCGPEGRFHQACEEFVYRAMSGESITLPFSVYGTLPVDVNGDGRHEFFGNGKLIDAAGNVLAEPGGKAALLQKVSDWPGEQILCWYPDGKLILWTDTDAVDTEIAAWRYASPFYQTNKRLTSTGDHLEILGGI